MSDIKNIDELFSSKLGGREVAYEADAWVGAEQLLNEHYRWAFLKKLFYFGTPAALSVTLVVAYFVTSTPETAANELNIKAVSENPQTATEQNAGLTSPSNTISLESNEININSNTTEIVSTLPTTDKAVISEHLATSQTHVYQQPILSQETSEEQIIEGSGEAIQAKNLEIKSGKAIVKVEKESALNLMPTYAHLRLNYNHVDKEMCYEPINQAMINALKKFEFNVGGGIIGALGFQNDQIKRASPSLGYYLGLSADYHFNRIFFIETGIGVQARGSLANDDVFVTDGVTHSVHSISANYLNIPLSFNYRISTRHSFGGGIQFNPLLTVVARDKMQSNNVEGTTSKLVLDKTGFVNMDFAVFAKYRYELAPKWILDAQFQYGMTDATENNGTNKVDDRNILVKGGISYRLINL